MEDFSPSPPDVFSFAKRVLESLGVTEWMRYREAQDLVEFCREGDEGTTVTIILHDNPHLEWEAVLFAVAHSSCLDLDVFKQRAKELSSQ